MEMKMEQQTESSALKTAQIPFSEIPPGLGAMAVMGHEGDTKTVWDKSKPEEVEAARRQFDFLTQEKKYLAFAVDRNDPNKPGEPVKTFDPNLERIIFTPNMQGG